MSEEKIYIYSVLYRGEFPIDMIRRDECYPADALSTEVMWTTIKSLIFEKKHQVNLRSHKEPTVKRWESWKVDVLRDEDSEFFEDSQDLREKEEALKPCEACGRLP